MQYLPRIMLAAPSSGSGKTMITCGILQAFADRGLHPASFKCGPDYIDPMFHTKVIGARSRNLDTFFTDRETTRRLFARTASKAGISVLEGVMGMYDGLGGTSAEASSYDLAAATDTPVLLVVNARGMGLSVIPLIQGFLSYQERLGKRVISGVILNRMTEMTYRRLKGLIEAETGIRLFGYVPELAECSVESRHLGLVTPDEISDLRQRLERLSAELERSLDMEALLALAHGAEDYEESEVRLPDLGAVSAKSRPDEGRSGRPRIAVAADEAFCFYYQDNLDLLEALGAELAEFSPLHDTALPPGTAAFLLGGGYPELYADRLSENAAMRREILRAVRSGMPYLAECGGFMYLHETMEDMDGTAWPMCGAVHGKAFRTGKLSRFGYVELQENGASRSFLGPGQKIRGHEFHYFDSEDPGGDFTARKPNSGREWSCIHADERSAAGYPHLYYWSNPQFAASFVACAERYAGVCREQPLP